MNWQWGITISLPEQFKRLPPELPPEITALELPGETVDSASGCDLLHQLVQQKRQITIIDLLPPDLARLIPGESRQLQNEFDQQFRTRCRRAAQLNVREFSLSFDLALAAANPDFAEDLQSLLRRCSGVLAEFKLTMRLPCRIPGSPGQGTLSRQLEFIRNLLYPGFKLVLEMHPHEPHAPGEPDQSLRSLIFADNYRRLRYEPENGNQLTPAVVERCLTSFSPESSSRHILFLSPEHGLVDEAMLSTFTRIINDRSKE